VEAVEQYIAGAQPQIAETTVPDAVIEQLVNTCANVPPAAECDTGLADALSNLGVRLLEADRRALALAVADTANQHLPAAPCGHTTCRRVQAEVASNLSRARRDGGYPARGVEEARRALEQYRGLYDDDPVTYRGDWGIAERRYARCLASVGRLTQAVRHAQRAVDLFDTAARRDWNRWKPDQARAHQNLAEWLIEAGRTDEAADQLSRARSIWDELAKGHPLSVEDQIAQCHLLESRISTHRLARDAEYSDDKAHEAGAAAEQAVTVFKAVSESALGARDSLAEAYITASNAEAAMAGRSPEEEQATAHRQRATAYAEQACEIMRELAGQQVAFRPSLSRALLALSECHERSGNPQGAEDAATEAVQAAEHVLSSGDPGDTLQLVHAHLARAKLLQVQPTVVLKDLLEARRLLEDITQLEPGKHPDRLEELTDEVSKLLTKHSSLPVGEGTSPV
jgi:tetratricopeptide (TPR) repeat protein